MKLSFLLPAVFCAAFLFSAAGSAQQPEREYESGRPYDKAADKFVERIFRAIERPALPTQAELSRRLGIRFEPKAGAPGPSSRPAFRATGRAPLDPDEGLTLMEGKDERSLVFVFESPESQKPHAQFNFCLRKQMVHERLLKKWSYFRTDAIQHLENYSLTIGNTIRILEIRPYLEEPGRCVNRITVAFLTQR